MTQRNKNGLAVLIRVVILCCSWITVVRPLSGVFTGGLSGNLLYFPALVSLLVMILSGIYLGLGIRTRMTGGTRVPLALQIARYAVVVSVTIMELLFWVSIFPVIYSSSPFTLTPLLAYVVVPLLFITDFLLFDRGAPMGSADVVWAGSIPLLYSVIVLFYSSFNSSLTYNDGPFYFSLSEIDIFGLFGISTNLGALWWALIMIVLSLLIGYGFRWIQLKTIQPEAAETQPAPEEQETPDEDQ